jgi:hypothetical protein
MPGELARQHLEQAERHVLLGMRHVMRQRELIQRLESGGHDTREANRLLRQFEDLLELHIHDRDRLRREVVS